MQPLARLGLQREPLAQVRVILDGGIAMLQYRRKENQDIGEAKTLARMCRDSGVPFVVTGVAFDRMAGAFSFVKRHFRVINLVAGAFLFAFGFLLFTHRLTRLSSYFTDALHFLHLDALTKI